MCDLGLGGKELLQKGREAYLAHVIDILTPKMTLENAPTVREFLDVTGFNNAVTG